MVQIEVPVVWLKGSIRWYDLKMVLYFFLNFITIFNIIPQKYFDIKNNLENKYKIVFTYLKKKHRKINMIFLKYMYFLCIFFIFIR